MVVEEGVDSSMVIEELLAEAIQLSASDTHISPNCPTIYRIHGRLLAEAVLIGEEDIQKWIEVVLDDRQMTSFYRDGQIDFPYKLIGVSRFRCNVYRANGQINLAIRTIPLFVPSLVSLGLPSEITKLSTMKQGLILVTGPTGHGKSTTLSAILREINTTFERHVITLEDPIEYRHENDKSIVHQREVGRDTESFSSGLRSALRQDPDVIMVGELRDLETVRTAVTASETGHLVLSSLHTSDAVQTIDRLIDMFPSDQQGQIRTQLADVLVAVISQRLLPNQYLDGRVALVELLLYTPAVANLIRIQKTYQLRSVMQTSRHLGMQTFAMAARDLMNAGRISEQVGMEYSSTSS